ncbi:MAG: hypothetical protein K6L75_16045 [Cellvibrionaceae bacterium]
MSPTTNTPASTNTTSVLAVSRPFIFQQRIILIIFSVIISTLVWWQSAKVSINHSVQKFTITAIPDIVAELNFTNAEAAWSYLQTDSEGNLKINAQLESALVEAIDVMQDQTSESQVARMGLLLEKQFGPTASQQFVALLPALKNYKEIEMRWLEKNNSNNFSTKKTPDHAELFQLQDELLGEALAEKMFSEQRRLAIMMSASLEIRNDINLTEAEKKQAMIDLQTRFQNNSQESAQENVKENLQESAPSE